MGPSSRCAVALLSAFVVGIAEAAARGDARGKVSPDVDKSDKKFFKKDFPWDKRPVADHHYEFDHPYPAVQDTGDFDKDFVKDENADGGKWNAQMEYDILRSKIRQAEKGLAEAKDKLEKEEAEWKSSKDKYSKTSADAHAAEAARKKAEQEAEEAEKKVNELSGGAHKSGTKVGGEVGEAVNRVQKEMDDLEECKKELAEAKRRLKELIKEKEDLDKKETEEEEVRVKEVVKVKKVKEQEKKKKDGERDAAEKEVEKISAEETNWKKKLAEEQKEHTEASKSYEEELADVKRTEAQLKIAEKNLRKFRRPPYVDGNGGVYNVPDEKGGARHSLVAIGAVVAMVAAAAL